MRPRSQAPRPCRSLWVAAVAVALAVLAACSVEQALAPPRCNGGSGLIEAQSVPTAQRIPCFGELPDGWSFASVGVDQDGTVVRLDSDRAGDNAATFRFEETCDIGDAVPEPSSYEGVAHFDAIERLQPSFRARSYLQFDGGCVTWIYDFDRGASATESVAVEEALEFITRRDLNDSIRDTFIDAEL